MAEAEDVITDAARHATEFVQGLWRRHRAGAADAPVRLEDVARRLDLLVLAAFGRRHPIRVAQLPAPPSLLTSFFQRNKRPWRTQAVPATDGVGIMLPASLGIKDATLALQHYRTMALQQAMRATRGSAGLLQRLPDALHLQVYLLLEAVAADIDVAAALPGMVPALQALRGAALQARPALTEFSAARRPLEIFLRRLLASPVQQHSGQATGSSAYLVGAGEPTAGSPGPGGASVDRTGAGRPGAGRPLLPNGMVVPRTPAESLALVPELVGQIWTEPGLVRHVGADALLKDWWTGDLQPAPAGRAATDAPAQEAPPADDEASSPRSARLSRRPQVREAAEDEDDAQQGMWMVHSAPPEEHAEDPMGMQRPTDRDEKTAAEDFADSLSELPEARLVTTPGKPREVLLSDDPPDAGARPDVPTRPGADAALRYPEWDERIHAYHRPGATVHLLAPGLGSPAWVDDTLSRHRSLLNAIRKRFEMLRAQRMRLQRQLDGDDIDLNAVTEAMSDFRAGLPLSQRLYQTVRMARRDMAVTLLIDVSGSTDAWIAAHRRVIDVEREALLLVCNALEGMGEPYSILAFSGTGPQGVTVRSLKDFAERYDREVALRIAGLEPEDYTRAGAAIRHATSMLMQQPAKHRLLLMLSDGKPNDVDQYEGRYGVADMRQAVREARMQGIFPFCLTIDSKAPDYMPAIFGASQYALLPRPELLPTALLDWMKRLLTQ